MLTTNNNDILFDDVAEIENSLGKDYLETSKNPSSDCDCTSYTGVESDEKFSAETNI